MSFAVEGLESLKSLLKVPYEVNAFDNFEPGDPVGPLFGSSHEAEMEGEG